MFKASPTNTPWQPSLHALVTAVDRRRRSARIGRPSLPSGSGRPHLFGQTEIGSGASQARSWSTPRPRRGPQVRDGLDRHAIGIVERGRPAPRGFHLTSNARRPDSAFTTKSTSDCARVRQKNNSMVAA